MAQFSTEEAIVANGGTTSNAIDIRKWAALGIAPPAGGITSATISFSVAPAVNVDPTNPAVVFQPLRDLSNVLITITLTSGASYPLPDELAAFGFFKVVTAGAEAAARTFVISKKAP